MAETEKKRDWYAKPAKKGKGGDADKAKVTGGEAGTPEEPMPERHMRELGELHSRHEKEHADMHSRHKGEHEAMMSRMSGKKEAA